MRPLSKIIIILAGALAAGCSPESPPPSSASAPSALALSGLPIEMTVKQRSTTVVPGSGGAARLTADNITHGQVMVSLAGKDGGVLLGQTSFKTGDSWGFKLGGNLYMLTLKELNNALVGEDFATFVVSAASASPLSETAKIERLIARVAAMQGATFIRNGVEYNAADAADHLRSKWKAAGSENPTAKDFVERIASESSVSGEPYRIRLSDGSVVLAKDYLLGKLGDIEQGL